MKKFLIGFILIFASGVVSAACPNIRGIWGTTYDAVYLGNTWAGIGRAALGSSSFVVKGFESYQGVIFAGTIRGKYSVNQKCIVSINYTVDGSDVTGIIKGVIINSDKIFFMFSNDEGRTGRVVAERMTNPLCC